MEGAARVGDRIWRGELRNSIGVVGVGVGVGVVEGFGDRFDIA